MNHRNHKYNRLGVEMWALSFIGINGLLVLASCDVLGSKDSDMMYYEPYGTYTPNGNGGVYEEDELTKTYQMQSQRYKEENQAYQTEEVDIITERKQRMKEYKKERYRFLNQTSDPYEINDDDGYIP